MRQGGERNEAEKWKRSKSRPPHALLKACSKLAQGQRQDTVFDVLCFGERWLWLGPMDEANSVCAIRFAIRKIKRCAVVTEMKMYNVLKPQAQTLLKRQITFSH